MKEYPESLITAFLTSYKPAEIMKLTGISKTKYYRLKRDPDFQKILTERRTELVKSAVMKMESYLTEDVHVKSITYRNGDDSVFSGYASDGRIWYMKKKLTKGGEVIHAKILVLLYPKAMQSDVEKLIEVVKRW